MAVNLKAYTFTAGKAGASIHANIGALVRYTQGAGDIAAKLNGAIRDTFPDANVVLHAYFTGDASSRGFVFNSSSTTDNAGSPVAQTDQDGVAVGGISKFYAAWINYEKDEASGNGYVTGMTLGGMMHYDDTLTPTVAFSAVHSWPTGLTRADGDTLLMSGANARGEIFLLAKRV